MPRILCLAVHPDDETLGCGGTLLKHITSGDEVTWAILTEMRLEFGYDKKTIANRIDEIDAVSRFYGFSRVVRLGFPTTRLDQVPRSDLSKSLMNLVESIQAEVVYLPFRSDIHSDHRIAFEAASTCMKSFRFPSIKRVLMMETMSETEFAASPGGESFAPNAYSDISIYFKRKLEGMRLFGSEMEQFPFPRSEGAIEALSRFRGSIIGVEHAEAFMLLKEVW